MKLSGISSIQMWSNTLKRKHMKRREPVQQRQNNRMLTLCQVYNLLLIIGGKKNFPPPIRHKEGPPRRPFCMLGGKPTLALECRFCSVPDSPGTRVLSPAEAAECDSDSARSASNSAELQLTHSRSLACYRARQHRYVDENKVSAKWPGRGGVAPIRKKAHKK